MARGSNLRFFLLLLLLLFVQTACEKNKNDVIPDVYINFYLDLEDPEFLDLRFITNSLIVTSATNNIGPNSAGFSGNGIIVYHSTTDTYLAFDRTCPHDYVNGGEAIKVVVDFVSAVCPVCETNYALSSGGEPVSGPGKYYLKNYRTSFDGRFIRVWNHF